jgi:hypothetical protein
MHRRCGDLDDYLIGTRHRHSINGFELKYGARIAILSKFEPFESLICHNYGKY